MDDLKTIVERLRYCTGPWSDPRLAQDAKDEIERLRAEVRDQNEEIAGTREALAWYPSESVIVMAYKAVEEVSEGRKTIDRLRAALARIANMVTAPELYNEFPGVVMRQIAREALRGAGEKT